MSIKHADNNSPELLQINICKNILYSVYVQLYHRFTQWFSCNSLIVSHNMIQRHPIEVRLQYSDICISCPFALYYGVIGF